MGVPLLRGRGFEEADLDAEQPVTIISQGLAERLLPGEDPIGQRLALWQDPERVHTVVGVVGNVNDVRIDGERRLTVYFPERGYWPWMTLLVRVQGSVSSVAGSIRQAIWQVDPSLPLPTVETLDQRKAAAASPQRFTTVLMATFSAISALLAALGIYGLLSFLVASRGREIGIRLALGAQRSNVLGLMIGRAMRIVSVGIALGLVSALALHRTIESLLFETAATEPGLYAAAALGLTAVALIASYLPARRASRLSPTIALSSD